MLNNYGEIKFEQLSDAEDFWTIMDELLSDFETNGNNFYCNRNILLHHFINGTLFTLRINETQAMYTQYAQDDEIFCKSFFDNNTPYLLPCFIALKGEDVDMIWVHPRARRLGLASNLVKLSGAKTASLKIKGSEDFWNSLNF